MSPTGEASEPLIPPIKLDFYVQLECPAEERWSEKIGPFSDYLHLTYDLLRCSSDTFDVVAYYSENGDWRLDRHYSGGDDNWYSDVILWAEARPEPKRGAQICET